MNPLAPKTPHHKPKAKSCIFLTMLGGVSQMDTFDPKPALEKFDNTVMDWSKEKNTDQANLFAKPRLILRSPFPFKKYGQCGTDVSSLFPHMATCVDDMAFVRSIQTENGNHPAAVFLMNTGVGDSGQAVDGRVGHLRAGHGESESAGVCGAAGFPLAAVQRIAAVGRGFLAGELSGHGAAMEGRSDSRPEAAGRTSRPRSSRREMDCCAPTTRTSRRCIHAIPTCRAASTPTSWRIACRRRFRACSTWRRSPTTTREMYGLNDPVTESFGKRCLMARQLVEKGVRFVQLYTPSQSWDGHTEIVKNHTKNAAETDKPIAALLKDLKRRGLLDSTLVVWMGEFGRTPDNPADLRDKAGRDHNTRAMTIWMAGGGIKPGALVGATDDLGFKAVEDIYRMRDVHATVMHLMGLNDMKLTYYSAGRNQRLTDTGGKVIQGILA